MSRTEIGLVVSHGERQPESPLSGLLKVSWGSIADLPSGVFRSHSLMSALLPIVLKKSCFVLKRWSQQYVFELWGFAKRRTWTGQRGPLPVMRLPGSSAGFLA